MIHPLQSIYDKIPKMNCKGECGRNRHDTCCGPIGCTALEAKLLDEYNGQPSEWIGCDNGNVRMDIEKIFPMMLCPHLGVGGQCTAYAVRPMICRLWGTTARMKCQWGCQPERWLSDKEVWALLSEAEKINQNYLKDLTVEKNH